MGFPSPASDYVEQRLSVNSICNVGPNTQFSSALVVTLYWISP